MLKRVNAILWRNCNQATFDTLNGVSGGQYDIRLTRRAFDSFFQGVPKTKDTDLGGYDLVVPLQPFDGHPPVSATTLTVRYMGDKSSRKDWNIPSQRPTTAYPLWRPGRGVSTTYNENTLEYAVIIRDENGGFHARWIDNANFAYLPQTLQNLLKSNEVGVKEWP